MQLLDTDLTDQRLARLRIQHLRLVRAIGACSTMHEAAEQLHLTQSAASKMLREVEAALGTRLFERGRTGAHPTPAGRALVHRAVRLLQDLEAARQEQAEIGRGMSVLLRLGGLPVAMVTIVPKVFEHCLRHWPTLLLQTREATARQLVRDVLNGVVDCGLGRVHPDDHIAGAETQLVQDRLGAEEIALVASRTHPIARRQRVTLESALRHEWILPPAGTVSRTALTQMLQERSLPLPRARMESDASFGTLLNYVRDFGLLALMPRSVALKEAARGTISVLRVPLDLQLPPMSLLCLRNRADEPDLARFRSIVLTCAHARTKDPVASP